MRAVDEFERLIHTKISEYANDLVDKPAKSMEDYNRRLGVINGFRLALEIFDEIFKPSDDSLPGISDAEIDEY